MDVVRHEHRLTNGEGLPVAVAVHAPAGGAGGGAGGGAPLPVTVVCHGFKGFKDWGMFPFVCDRLAAGGRTAVRFDFSHNGIGDVPGEFTRLDLFREQTATRAVADLALVLDAIADGVLAPELHLARDLAGGGASVIGHSMGGGVALLRAAVDARIGRVATLNGVGTFDRLGPGAKKQLAERGEVVIVNARTGQQMPLGRAWFDDLASADVEAAARGLTIPVTVVQGSADEAVPLAEGERLAGWIEGATLHVVEGADHVFDIRHPFEGPSPALEEVLGVLDAFLPSAAGHPTDHPTDRPAGRTTEAGR